MIRAIFWDNDGVLVDTEGLYFASTQEHLSGLGVVLTQEDFIRISLREGRSVFDLALARGVGPEAVAAAQAARNRRYRERLLQGVAILPGVLEILSALRGRVFLGMVTSARKEHVEAMHATTGLLPLFDFVLAREDYGRSKPHPDPYLAAIERAGLPPGACLAVEDSERGLAAARAAGLPCIAVPHGLTVGGDFSGAQQVFADMVEAGPYLLARLGGPGDAAPAPGLPSGHASCSASGGGGFSRAVKESM